jgi:hypothetical protein
MTTPPPRSTPEPSGVAGNRIDDARFRDELKSAARHRRNAPRC